MKLRILFLLLMAIVPIHSGWAVNCGLLLATSSASSAQLAIEQVSSARIHQKVELVLPAGTYPFPTKIIIYQLAKDQEAARDASATYAKMLSFRSPFSTANFGLQPSFPSIQTNLPTWSRDYQLQKQREERANIGLADVRNRWAFCQQNRFRDSSVLQVEFEFKDNTLKYATGAGACALVGLKIQNRFLTQLAKRLAQKAIREGLAAALRAEEGMAMAHYISAIQNSYASDESTPDMLTFVSVTDGHNSVSQIASYLKRHSGFMEP